jgi:hypothetical protein
MSPMNTLIRTFRRASDGDRAEGSSQSAEASLPTPTELPLWTESDSKEKTTDPEDNSKDAPLGLPASLENEELHREFEYIKLRLWNQEYRVTQSTTRTALKRTIKSLLLVLKVCILLSAH